MPQQDRPRARARQRDDDDAGFDVWIPMIVALAAAIYLVVAAQAQGFTSDAPRAIFDASRFEESAVQAEAAEARAARDLTPVEAAEAAARVQRLKIGPVIIAALPEIAPAVVESDPEARAAGWAQARPMPVEAGATGLGRILTPIGIALLLIAVLFGLDRTWQRTRGRLAV